MVGSLERIRLSVSSQLPVLLQMHYSYFIAPGVSLVKLGQAHSKVATLQEAYTLTFQDTFVASTKGFSEDIKDYEHQRKKLESRRYVLYCRWWSVTHDNLG